LKSRERLVAAQRLAKMGDFRIRLGPWADIVNSLKKPENSWWCRKVKIRDKGQSVLRLYCCISRYIWLRERPDRRQHSSISPLAADTRSCR